MINYGTMHKLDYNWITILFNSKTRCIVSNVFSLLVPGDATPMYVKHPAANAPEHIGPDVVGLRCNISWEATTLHDAEELLLVHLAITVAVGLVNHLLELLVGHVLAELLGHTLEVLERDLAGLIVVEEAEHLDNLLARVAVAHARGHHA